MATNLTKDQAVAIANRARRERQRNRQSSRNLEAAIVHKASVALSAAGIAALQRAGVSNQVWGVPWKVPAFLVFTALEAFLDNRIASAIFGGASDATLAIYEDRSIGGKYGTGWDALAVAGEGDI